jgi:hypothetical protein
MDLPTLYIRAHVALHAAAPDALCWQEGLLLRAAYEQLPPPAVIYPDWIQRLAHEEEPDQAKPLADAPSTPLYPGKTPQPAPAPAPEATP